MRKKSGILGIVIALAAGVFFAYCGIMTVCVPDIITLRGNTQSINFRLPMSATISNESTAAVTLNGERLADKTSCDLSEPIRIEADNDANLSVDLFGIFHLKDISIRVEQSESERKTLIAGGQSIGVTLKTRGALIVGVSQMSDISGEKVNPASEAGLKPGDVIIAVNGAAIENADHLSELINEVTGDTVALTVDRNGERFSAEVSPVLDDYDGAYRLGVWVRDSTAGVGTLTYIDPETEMFAGLGHAIIDLDTGSELSVKAGEIVCSDIIDVVKGEAGAPGELKGYFNSKENGIGTISKNTKYGIFGTVYDDALKLCGGSEYQIAYKEEVKEGEGYIIATVDNNGPQKYSCYISDIVSQSYRQQKSFMVTITDSGLLSKTGGIVQGMSGSPIIQDNKIIGAVTHVFVNDPTCGYGVYIQWMLEEENE